MIPPAGFRRTNSPGPERISSISISPITGRVVRAAKRTDRHEGEEPAPSGFTAKFNYRDAPDLSVAQGAKILALRQRALSNLVSGKSGVSPEMAVRLSKAFGSSPETWLGMQADSDLAEVLRYEGDIKVERVAAIEKLGSRVL